MKKKDPRLVDRDDLGLSPSEATHSTSFPMGTQPLGVPLKREPKAPALAHGLDGRICSKKWKHTNKEDMTRCDF